MSLDLHFTLVLIVRMAVTAGFVLAATVTAERAGPLVGALVATLPLGGTTEIEVQRGGKAMKLAIPLEEAPDTNRNEIVITSRSPFQGARVANISPAVADELRLDNSDGVVITELADDGTAANVGFKKGDVILAVNGVTINDTEDLQRVTRERNRLWRITVMRGGQQIQVTLGG